MCDQCCCLSRAVTANIARHKMREFYGVFASYSLMAFLEKAGQRVFKLRWILFPKTHPLGGRSCSSKRQGLAHPIIQIQTATYVSQGCATSTGRILIVIYHPYSWDAPAPAQPSYLREMTTAARGCRLDSKNICVMSLRYPRLI